MIKYTIDASIIMTYHSVDRADRPNLDCVLLKQLVNVVEDGLHAWEIFFVWYAEWLPIVAKHLEVGWGHNKLKHVINIATFWEILNRPGFQMTTSIMLGLVCFICNLRGTLLKKTSHLRCVEMEYCEMLF